MNQGGLDVIKCYKYTLSKNREKNEEEKHNDQENPLVNHDNVPDHVCIDCGLPDPGEKDIVSSSHF